MDASQRDKKLELIKNQCALLAGSFDSVQIFATKDEPDTHVTSHYAFGSGNWYARYGQVKDWTIREENRSVEEENEDS